MRGKVGCLSLVFYWYYFPVFSLFEQAAIVQGNHHPFGRTNWRMACHQILLQIHTGRFLQPCHRKSAPVALLLAELRLFHHDHRRFLCNLHFKVKRWSLQYFKIFLVLRIGRRWRRNSLDSIIYSLGWSIRTEPPLSNRWWPTEQFQSKTRFNLILIYSIFISICIFSCIKYEKISII